MTDPGSEMLRITVAEERDAFIRRSLIARLLAEQTVAELANLPLGALAVVLTWGSVNSTIQFTWFALLAIATLVRMVVRRTVEQSETSHGIPNRLRVAIVGVAAVWSVGLFLVAPHIQQTEVALLLLFICGLTAAATATLLADPKTYVAYTACLLGFTALGALRLSSNEDFAVAFIVILLFGGVMATLYSRLRKVLLQSLMNEYELERSRADADRERAFLDKLISSAPNAIVVVDAAHRVVRANRAFERLFGYSIVDIAGVPLDQLILAPSQVESSRQFQTQIASGRTVHLETQRRRKDGSEIDVMIWATHLESDDGGGTLVIYEDITERKLAERALRDSEARLFRTLASLPVGIMVIDPDGVPYFVNDAARELLGAGVIVDNDVERLASTYHAYIAGTDTLYPAERMPIVRALRGEEATVDDMEVRRPDDTIVLEVFGSPIRDVEGNVMFGVAAFMDITERRRVADALQAARVAAEEATASKSAFLANMSHEIRTPLNGILGMAELLLDANLGAEDRRSVELIITSGETLLRVINDILDFSKIEAGQLDIEETEVDLFTLVESTARLLMPRASSSGIEIVIEMDADVPQRVLGDPTRIRQVLANLIGNAVKFTQKGEVVVHVQRLKGEDEHRARLRFSVRDTGTGIPAEKLGTIFEAFRQADTTTTRRYGGTGLGLSISRRLVELMGGQIAVESVEGMGSVFSFVLTMPIVSAVEPLRPAANLDGLRVLIVDDNATNRRVMRGIVESAGCLVTEVADGTDALHELRAGMKDHDPIGVVLSDLLMPGLDGFDLATAIRGDPTIAQTSIVLASSVSRRGDAQRVRDLRIAGYLLKPTSREELLEALRTAASANPTPAKGMIAVGGATHQAPVTALRVLIAEDNPVNQEVATAVLRRRGHAVDVVGTGRAAVDAVAHRDFDVVLMDIQMPEMDGLEATAAIRATERGKALRIIALTANAMSGERERCIAAGMDDYIAKPFKSVELLATVENRREPSNGVKHVGIDLPVDLLGLKSDLELGGVADILEDILNAFVADSPGRMDALREAVAGGEARTVERAAHAFKSSAATIRARKLAELLQRLEHVGHSGDLTGATTILSDIESAFTAVQQQLATPRGQDAHGK